MQQVRKPAAGLKALLGRIRHSQMLLGSTVVLVAVIALTAAGLLYLRPMHQKTIRFDTTDAASISVGESVRVVGIDVGKVTKLSIQPDTVQVEARVSDNTFIGSDSTVEIRMLTPVGGYAVTVVPAGNAPLGDKVIPVDHVSAPYSIGDVLQAAPNTTDKVKGGTIDANIDQVAQALQHNSSSVSSIIQGMNSIATVMDQQRDQVRTITDLASEYLQTFNGSREWVYELLRKSEIVVTTYDNTHVGFNRAYQLLGDLLYRVAPIESFLLEHNSEVKPMIEKLRSSIADFQQGMGPAIGQLQNLRDRLAAWLGPNGLATLSGGTISASDICVPIPGRTC
ncbi:MlaD family protein [Nocardia miyunensis]|uniref:MlaD family protein n=1 Tax=Nocardia miyunensis TaxID=282684 RepID=UPI000A00BE9A|nr:MlaD family protein [Nocardia miyunensis]